LQKPGVVVGFGEVLLRLATPLHLKLQQATQLDMVFGGAEANVMVGLHHLGHATRMVSVLPNGALGDAALAYLRANGVDTHAVARQDGRLGLYFLEPGAGERASQVLYDRAGSCFAESISQTYDWESAFVGAAILHVSGVTPALGPRGVDLLREATRRAKSNQIPIVFDGNFRASLWQKWNADPAPVLRELMAQADVLFANHRDMSLVLGMRFDDTSEAGALGRQRAAADAAFAAFPQLKVFASTTRHADSTDAQRLSARVDTRTHSYQTDERVVSGIIDRIGAGDAFAAGALHALRTALGSDDEATVISEMAECGLALSVLKHSLPGDASLFTPDDIASLRAGASDVRR
jgi:2-dehydro-3-deoxygluconokinase